MGQLKLADIMTEQEIKELDEAFAAARPAPEEGDADDEPDAPLEVRTSNGR